MNVTHIIAISMKLMWSDNAFVFTLCHGLIYVFLQYASSKSHFNILAICFVEWSAELKHDLRDKYDDLLPAIQIQKTKARMCRPKNVAEQLNNWNMNTMNLVQIPGREFSSFCRVNLFLVE